MSRRTLLMAGGGVAGLTAIGAVYEGYRMRLGQMLTAAGTPMPDHRVKLPTTSPRLVVARGRIRCVTCARPSSEWEA